MCFAIVFKTEAFLYVPQCLVLFHKSLMQHIWNMYLFSSAGIAVYCPYSTILWSGWHWWKPKDNN